MQQKSNHEVILFTSTNFAKKQFCGNDSGNSRPDQLQKTCWTGLIFEILPDISKYSAQKNKYHIWEITAAGNFLDVKIGDAPCSIEPGMSVNPHFFFLEKNFN